jgi:transcriptional regulator with XRE-family HTH domain
LADAAGLSEPTISRYLRGERLPSIRAVVNICHVLGLDFEDLIPTYDLIE